MASTSATPAAEDQGTKHSKSGTQAPAMLTSTQVISNPNPAAGVKDLTQDAIPPRNVGPSQAVRFASKNQEIEPSHSLHPESTLASSEGRRSPVELTPEAEAEIRTLSLSVHGSRLQQRRMSNFAFEPVSLPASRVSSVHFSLTNIKGSGGFSRRHLAPSFITITLMAYSTTPPTWQYQILICSRLTR